MSIVNARLHFLREASLSLMHTAPTVSAVLGAAYSQTCFQHNVEGAKVGDYENCSFCGNFLIPGRSCQVTPTFHDNRSGRANQNRKNHLRSIRSIEKRRRPANSLMYTCAMCNRNIPCSVKTATKLTQVTTAPCSPAALRTGRPCLSLMGGVVGEILAIGPVSSESRLSSNTSSKRRARVRKQGGLQAMLAKTKADTISSTDQALGLMDFMKSV